MDINSTDVIRMLGVPSATNRVLDIINRYSDLFGFRLKEKFRMANCACRQNERL